MYAGRAESIVHNNLHGRVILINPFTGFMSRDTCMYAGRAESIVHNKLALFLSLSLSLSLSFFLSLARGI
jgi:hypothetical protein